MLLTQKLPSCSSCSKSKRRGPAALGGGRGVACEPPAGLARSDGFSRRPRASVCPPRTSERPCVPRVVLCHGFPRGRRQEETRGGPPKLCWGRRSQTPPAAFPATASGAVASRTEAEGREINCGNCLRCLRLVMVMLIKPNGLEGRPGR